MATPGTARHESGRGTPDSSFVLLAIVPVAMLLPETVSVGGTFVRWDHVALALLAPVLLTPRPCGQPRVRYSTAGGVALGAALVLVADMWRAIPSSVQEATPLVKYALSPLKVIGWALLVRQLFARFRFGITELYRLCGITAALVFGMQVVELYSPAFRAALFKLYPVAAENRLQDLVFRARGPFGGYDVTSIFFAVVGVICVEYRAEPSRKGSRLAPVVLGICLAGAFIAARTGFLLLAAYLAVRLVAARRTRIRAAVGAIAGIVLLTAFSSPATLDGEDDSLLGRYLEVVRGVRRNDLRDVTSVNGTLQMNEDLFLGQSDATTWGQGLDTETTADQLYAKYLYMLGLVGLGLWCLAHLSLLTGALRTWRRGRPDAAMYGRAATAVGLILAVAHWKGGNYYFSSRCGEFACLVSALALSPPRARARAAGPVLPSPAHGARCPT